MYLICCQQFQMLDILESFVIKQGYNYLRMDGTTPISTRQPLVTNFNKVSLIHYIFTDLYVWKIQGWQKLISKCFK